MTRSINAGRRDEKPLMNFTEYHTFQGFYKVTPSDKDQTPEYAFNRCILHITNWLKNRIKLNKHYDSSEVQFLYDYPEPDSLLTEGFNVFADEDLHLKRAKKQFDISIFAIKEFGEWTIRIREPNNQSEKGYLDWLFTTDIALKTSGDFVYLAVRTKCKESHSHGKKASPFRTKCLQYIFKDESLIVSEGNIASHNYQVNMQKLSINRTGNRKKDEYEFIKIIKDPNRQMPVVFCPALFNEEDEKNGFRITKLSEHLSGTAYVVTDEMCNGYKELFKERMAEFLKEIGIKPADALTLITAGYLCIDPISDGAKTQWFMIDPHVREFETLDNTCEKVIRKEIGQVEEYIIDRMLSIDSDISYGETLFYSELWKKYINSSDSKRLEEAIAEREAAEQRIKLLIESHEEDTAAKIETVMKEYSEKMEASYKKQREADTERFKDQLGRKEAVIEEQRENCKNLEKENKELTESLRKKYDHKLENEKLKFFNSLLSKPYKIRCLNEWIRDNMGDRIILHKNAVDSYKNKQYQREDLLRNAFILLYADEKQINNEMNIKLYNEIKADPMLSSYEIDKSGGDRFKVIVDGQPAYMHVTYSEHGSDMFRIYYYRDKASKKIVVSLIEKHAE